VVDQYLGSAAHQGFRGFDATSNQAEPYLALRVNIFDRQSLGRRNRRNYPSAPPVQANQCQLEFQY
jgi:hypothetical protein